MVCTGGLVVKVQKEEKDKERNSEGTDQWERVRPSPWSRNNQTTGLGAVFMRP